MTGRFIKFEAGALILVLATVLLAGCPLPPTPTPTNPAGVVMSRDVADTYVPGESMAVTVTINASNGGDISAIGLFESIPEGWSFVSASGPPILPAVGTTGRIDFAWILPPTFPYVFTYHIQAPLDGRGEAEIEGEIEYREGAGPYTVAGPVSTLASTNTAGLVLGRSHESTFEPGGEFTVTIDIELDSAARISAMGLAETIPDGWSLAGVFPGSGANPDVFPEIGSGGLLEFVWIVIPEFPYTFSYTLAVPDGATGSVELLGHVDYRETAGPLSTGALVTSVEAASP